MRTFNCIIAKRCRAVSVYGTIVMLHYHIVITWRHSVKEGAVRVETKVRAEATIKRAVRKERQVSVREATNYICTSCNKDCHSRIGF